MRATTVKAIRRAMRAELVKGSGKMWIAHPKPYINVSNQPMLKYTFQYLNTGGRALVRFGKKIYKKYGILPRIPARGV